MSRPAMATPSGRNVCKIRIVPLCAASTSGRRRYACGASSRSPPRKATPLSAIHFIISSCLTRPSRRILFLPTFSKRPLAAVRDMSLPAPWIVENNASREIGESIPSMITASSPMLPPTKPFWQETLVLHLCARPNIPRHHVFPARRSCGDCGLHREFSRLKFRARHVARPLRVPHRRNDPRDAFRQDNRDRALIFHRQPSAAHPFPLSRRRALKNALPFCVPVRATQNAHQPRCGPPHRRRDQHNDFHHRPCQVGLPPLVSTRASVSIPTPDHRTTRVRHASCFCDRCQMKSRALRRP